MLSKDLSQSAAQLLLARCEAEQIILAGSAADALINTLKAAAEMAEQFEAMEIPTAQRATGGNVVAFPIIARPIPPVKDGGAA